MEKVIKLYKPLGLTPLQAVNQFRKDNPEYKDSKIAYAGRLDPLAHGILLLLIDEECKKRDLYQELDKVYKFEIMFGFKTDTHDVMGIPEIVDLKQPDNKDLEQVLPQFTGKIKQHYPQYSSYRIDGKPLFAWAREGKIDQIQIPSKMVSVKTLKILDNYVLTSLQVLEQVKAKISKVEGDFRQEQIIDEWQDKLTSLNTSFRIFSLEAQVSSGTYIRSLVDDIGNELGMGAVAFDIERVEIITNY